MSKDTEGNIYGGLEFLPITLFSNKLKVLIVGGGKGAFIKCRNLYKKCLDLQIVATNFIMEFNEFTEGVTIINGHYEEAMILDKHLVIVAIDNNEHVHKIIEDCERHNKLYINSTNFKSGMGLLPTKVESENIMVALNTKGGNPKGALFIKEILSETIGQLDDFIKFTTDIRNNFNINIEIKKEIISFVNSGDFKFFFDKGQQLNILQMFYDDILMEGKDEINSSN